jgi:putative PIN family toxin of toxin-antitoxin system
VRVVLDTNVLVSALLSPNGSPGRIVSLARAGFLTPFVSPAILLEYAEVLSRPKFQQTQEDLASYLSPFYLPQLCVFPEKFLKLCLDPDADRFLECAEAAQVRAIVTGNLRHFPPTFGQIRILSPSDFLKHLSTPF